ncbi:uncharacterized protein N7511_005753 [Penicillium nucicola]|uniref:uncharacterized protein n=1 Tax=Penicillium nucicola TaxID=1850975 RepID=UPI002544E8FC|nr:uncharacterized protein N7511_005753 [Penicillium nucicola]KAJ5762371.1 hypothetical protein N7511_005753 [Penicillium nucicola]
MSSFKKTHKKNIFDYMLSDERNQAEATAGLNDTVVYKASAESPLNGSIKWDWPLFPPAVHHAVRPAALRRDWFPARRNTDHFELRSPVAPFEDTSFTNPNVLPSHFCEDLPYPCDPVVTQEFYNTTFDPELMALLNDTAVDVTAAIAALDTYRASTTAGHSVLEESTQSTATGPPIIDLLTPPKETARISTEVPRTIQFAPPILSAQHHSWPCTVTPVDSAISIDLTVSPPNPNTQTSNGTKRAIPIPKEKPHASFPNEWTYGTQKKTLAQCTPLPTTAKRYPTPNSLSPGAACKIASNPPVLDNNAVFKTPQRAPPNAPLNTITPVTLETQKPPKEQQYSRQQSIYGDRQQQLKIMNETFQNNLQEQIDFEKQQSNYLNQLSQATQSPQLIQSLDSFDRESGRADYLRQLQQARQQQTPLMQTSQASNQLANDENHQLRLQMSHQQQPQQQKPHQQQPCQPTQKFMFAPQQMEHEQRLSNMPLVNPQQQYLMSSLPPQACQATQGAQWQMEYNLHMQQQALQGYPPQKHPRHLQQLPLTQPNMTPGMPQLAYPPQQVQGTPIQANHWVGPAYGAPYPNQQLQAVPHGQIHYAGQTPYTIALPAQEYQSAFPPPPYQFAAGRNQPIDRMHLVPSEPSNKRNFALVDNIVPDCVVTNPKSGSRWFIPNSNEKGRIFLPGPKGKKARKALKL